MKPANMRYVFCENHAGYAASLTPQRVYEVIPDPAEANGMLRVIDDTGEDYLFEADLFREIDNLTGVATEVTVGLTWPMKAAIHRIASQRGISMSALIREWIDAQLDLPLTA
jgi:hypothetical protein